MKTFFNMIAVSQLIIMGMCIAAASLAICSFNAGMATYKASVTWQMISWGTFIVSAFVCIASAAKADRLKK